MVPRPARLPVVLPILLPILFPIVLAPAAPAAAASFPCEGATAPDEVAICAERALNDLDVETAVRFAILKDVLPMGGQAKVREDQQTWLDERRACGADTACLRGVYEARLSRLRAVFAEFTQQGPP